MPQHLADARNAYCIVTEGHAVQCGIVAIAAQRAQWFAAVPQTCGLVCGRHDAALAGFDDTQDDVAELKFSETVFGVGFESVDDQVRTESIDRQLDPEAPIQVSQGSVVDQQHGITVGKGCDRLAGTRPQRIAAALVGGVESHQSALALKPLAQRLRYVAARGERCANIAPDLNLAGFVGVLSRDAHFRQVRRGHAQGVAIEIGA